MEQQIVKVTDPNVDDYGHIIMHPSSSDYYLIRTLNGNYYMVPEHFVDFNVVQEGPAIPEIETPSWLYLKRKMRKELDRSFYGKDDDDGEED
jgi:hypothetical protein